MFGTKHIIILILSIALIVGLYFLSRKLKLKTMCKIMFYIGLISEIIKVFFYIVKNESKFGGILPKTDLPFHLCSIQIIFIAIICFTNNEKIKRVLFAFMMPSCLFGGIAAILIPTTSSLNYWIITGQYFLYHISLVVFALHLITTEEFKVTIKDYFNCLKFILALMIFAIYMNSILYDGESKINFMYVVSPPQEGLPFLNENKGWLVYILRYATLVFTCISICYVKPIITTLKYKFAKKEVLEKSNATSKESIIINNNSNITEENSKEEKHSKKSTNKKKDTN